MAGTIKIVRKPPKSMPVPTECRAGVAEVDITPHFRLHMAGYSLGAKQGHGLFGRLFARAFYFESPDGGRAAICVIDMMSCSRYLLEKTAERTATTCGISADRLIIHGTHTHTAPGNFYGDTFYNAAAQSVAGFDRKLADWVSGKIAEAVEAACADLGPARVGYAEEKDWRVNWNRSHRAFYRNEDRDRWLEVGYPGHGVPWDHIGDPAKKWVDPRLRVMTLSRPGKDVPFGVLGTFSCHSTALGTGAKYYSPDWPGYASMTARDALTPDGADAPVVAVGVAAAGDMTAVPPSYRDEEERQGVMLEAGRLVGERVKPAVERALGTAREFDVKTRYAEHDVSDRVVGNDETTRLANTWKAGTPTLGGSDEARSFLYGPLVHEGMTDSLLDPGDPHYPKEEPLGGLVAFTLKLVGTNPSKRYPLHVLRVGDVAFATVPGEPTVMQAFRMERDVRAALAPESPDSNVVVLGYSGDYSGYYTTEEEHGAQHYEGSSMLFGRNAGRHIQARLATLAAGSGSTPPGGDAVFDRGRRLNRFDPDTDGRDSRYTPQIERTGLTVKLSWRVIGHTAWLMCDGPLLTVEEKANGAWAPLWYRGRPFDDVNRFFHLERSRSVFYESWRVSLRLPKEVLHPVRPLRVRVHGRHKVSGFTLDVPGGSIA